MRVTVLEDARLEIWGRLKKSTAGACAVLLSQLSRKHLTANNVLFQNWYFLGVKNISTHPQNRILGRGNVWDNTK